MWSIAVGSAMLANLFLHALLTRAAPQTNTVMLFLAGGSTIGVSLTAWTWRVFGIFSIEFVSAALAYAALCELYLFLFTLALSSVSANVLVRLAKGPQDVDELDVSYDSAGMVEQRIMRMRAAGFIVSKADGFWITDRGAVIVRAYRLLRRLFQHT